MITKSGLGGADTRQRGATRHASETYSIQRVHSPQSFGKSKKITLKKELNVISGTALIVNICVGSGIFITSSGVFRNSRSFGLTILLWFLGGVMIYISSLCYLELSLLVKKSGSTYIYIKEAYSLGRTRPWMDTFGSLCSFVVAWTDVLILQPLSLSIISLTIGKYVCKPFFIHCQEMPIYAVRMVALFSLTLLTIINVYSVKLAAKLLTILSSIKLLILVLVIISGAWRLINRGSFPEAFNPFEGSSTSPVKIALGFYGVLWAYSGWDAGLMMQEEIKNKRTISWITFISIPIVMVLYILVSISFFAVLSYDQILSTDAIGLTFGDEMLGETGLVISCILIVVITFGSCHASLINASRELFVTAREGSMPQFISGVHLTQHTPVLAIVIESVLGAMLTMVGDVDRFVNAFNAAVWITYGAAIFGLIIMRITLPNKHRPFKVYLILPIIIVIVSILLVIIPLWQEPLPQLLAFAGMLAGVPVYFFIVMESPRKLRPKVLDKFSDWLTSVTSKLLNTELSGYIP